MTRPEKRLRDAVAEETGLLGLGLVTWMVGLVLAALPPAWWMHRRHRGEVHAARAAAGSSLLQTVAGLCAFFIGLILWIKGLGADIDTVAAGSAASDDGLRDTMVGHLSLTLSPILPFIYALTTWSGFLSALVFLGGLVRSLHLAVARENMPDPTLALVEALRAHATKTARAARRERAKGEWTPDRLISGDGSQGWRLRLVSCDDHPWREGGDVYIDGTPWRLIGRRETRDVRGQLRLEYDFRALAGAEAPRGFNAYRPLEPPLREG